MLAKRLFLLLRRKIESILSVNQSLLTLYYQFIGTDHRNETMNITGSFSVHKYVERL